MFGELIIMIVYLPILALKGIEGKMFRPMALTVVMALGGSLVCALTLMPVLASFFQSSSIWMSGVSSGMRSPVTDVRGNADGQYRGRSADRIIGTNCLPRITP